LSTINVSRFDPPVKSKGYLFGQNMSVCNIIFFSSRNGQILTVLGLVAYSYVK